MPVTVPRLKNVKIDGSLRAGNYDKPTHSSNEQDLLCMIMLPEQ